MLIVVVCVLVISAVNLLLLVLIVVLLLLSFFLLGLKIFLVGTVVGDLRTWSLIDYLVSLLNNRRLVVLDIRSSYNFRLLWLISVVVIGRESIGSISRFVSSYLNLSSLLISSPLAGVFIAWLLDIGVRSSDYGALSYRLLGNIVGVLEICLGVGVSWLVISGLIIEGFVSCLLILSDNSVWLFGLISLVVGVVLGVVVLNALNLVGLFLLVHWLCLLILILRIIHLSVLVISNGGFSGGGSFFVDLLVIVALEVVGVDVVTRNIITFTGFHRLLNTMLLHISKSQFRVIV